MQQGPNFNWEYQQHPKASSVREACEKIVARLLADARPFLALVTQDSRPWHHEMFALVAPDNMPYFAGNYRGAPFPLLDSYDVQFGGQAGRYARLVEVSMQMFHGDMVDHCDSLPLDAGELDENAKREHLLKVAAFAAEALTYFLTIHPYANGNGHVARLLVWSILCIGGFPPRSWTLHKSPPGYGTLIQKFRDGDKAPLIKFILRNV